MCGISGIINGSIDPLLKNQIHRGPDGVGKNIASTEYDLWLGHNRLSIIDLSEKGSQPMESARYVLTYNGEIYNYKELQYYLHEFEGNDALTLLAYIERFGLGHALASANGMYGFGLFDKLYNKLHLVVDRFAQKPLYYYQEGETFAFASSPAALLHLRDKWKINEQALASYWKLGAVMIDSIWEGIKKVDGSEIVTYDLEKKVITKERYWQPEFQENTNGIEELILDAIRGVRVADVPVKIFLSGGIDSTLVASQFIGGEAIHMDGPERKYAQQVAKRFNINLHVVSPKEVCAKCGLKDYVSKTGEPTMAGLIPWITAREAVKFCKVAISANGADELFFGYDRTSDEITDPQLDNIFRRQYRDNPLNFIEPFTNIDSRLSWGRWLELQTYVKHDLNKTLDAASMCHSLEVRNPFLDHRLVEMALSIPFEKIGRKELLKNMLRKFGFDNKFLNRPKMGFTLYQEPKGYKELQESSYKWAIENKFLKLISQPNARDLMYLKASAAGFFVWWETFKEIIA
jgi:asparagine synthase (glutamine-hydrolysing)